VYWYIGYYASFGGWKKCVQSTRPTQ